MRITNTKSGLYFALIILGLTLGGFLCIQPLLKTNTFTARACC